MEERLNPTHEGDWVQGPGPACRILGLVAVRAQYAGSRCERLNYRRRQIVDRFSALQAFPIPSDIATHFRLGSGCYHITGLRTNTEMTPIRWRCVRPASAVTTWAEFSPIPLKRTNSVSHSVKLPPWTCVASLAVELFNIAQECITRYEDHRT